MDKREFATVVAMLKKLYPKENILTDGQAIDLWFDMLSDLDHKTVLAALKEWVGTHKWAPTIAEIREAAAEITYGAIPDWSDGWDQAMKAIHRYGSWDAQSAYREMDDLTAETVRRIGYVNLCLSENLSVDRASFRQIYTTLAERKKNDRQIAPSVAKLIDQIRNPMIEAKDA